MPHPQEPSRVVTVRPPLDPRETELVAGLAGAGAGPRRVWPGQPGRRSPWRPCPGGCCLEAEPRPAAELAQWLRFLLRELVAPRAREPSERAARLGLPGGHRVEGRLLLGGAHDLRLLVAVGRRVRVVPLDEDLFPVEPVRRGARGRGEVVELAGRDATADERSRALRRQSTER